MRTRKRRASAVLAVVSLLCALVAVVVGTPTPAGADTTQNFGCLGVTGTFSTFPVPITGLASPNPVTLGGSYTLQGTSIQVNVTTPLIIAGVNTGLVQAAATLADVGTPGGIGGTTQGENAVQVQAGPGTAANPTGVHLTMDGTNTSQGTQKSVNAAPTSFTFYATNDGTTVRVYQGTPNPPTNTNLTEVTAIPVTVSLADTTWTPSTGPSSIVRSINTQPSSLTAPTAADKAAAPLQLYSKINGLVTVNFFCWPGTASADGLSLVPLGAGPTSAIDTVTVNTPPTAPVCSSFSTTAPAGQSITVNLNTRCGDVNGNIDPATWTVGPTTQGGVLAPVVGQPGVYTYTAPATAPAVPDTFTFSVNDTGGLAGNTATASISVLGNLCDATGTPSTTVPVGSLSINVAYNPASCSLRQVITTPVLGATRTLEQTGSSITMVSAASIAGPDGLPGTPDDTPATAAPIVLNGQPQLAVGRLNQLTVNNSRGDDAGWTVTGQVTPLLDALRPGTPPCVASTPATWSNHCIPGDNLGWIPSAAIAHTVIPGDVAQVNPGTTLFSPGFFTNVGVVGGITGAATGLGTSAQTLCSSPATHSGGTFTCDASLGLSVPASAAAGIYGGVLTLTLA